MAVVEACPPLCVGSEREKKYFSSNTPDGVAMYLLLVTRQTVDSCRPTSCAMSRSASGFIAIGPYSKKWRWWRTMALATSRMVAKRCSTLRSVQRASRRWAARSVWPVSRWRWNKSA